MNDCSTRLKRWRQWERKYPVFAFPMIYLGWAYLFWTPALLSDESVWSFPNLLWFLIGGASPLLAGLSLAALSGGKRRLIELAHSLVDWRRITGGFWLLLLFFWLVFDLTMAGIAVLIGVTDSALDVHWSLFSEPSILLFLFLLSFVFPAVEEIGLRGYYLDTLQQRLGPLAAGLINGLVWAAWHTPFVYFSGYYANTTFDPALSWWLPMILCQTLLIVQVYTHTRRSLLAVVVFHGMMNFTGEWLRISPDMYPFMLTGNVIAALAVVFWWRAQQSSTKV